jgi:hypothetical protein
MLARKSTPRICTLTIIQTYKELCIIIPSDKDEKSKADIEKKLKDAEERREQLEAERLEKLKEEHEKV